MTTTFDGVAKQITVSDFNNFDTVDVQKDIYSAWKRWFVLSDNAKYLQAFRPIGGDATGGTQTAPPYFFLMNNWKVVVDGIQNLGFNTNLYCEEASNISTNPFLIINGGSVLSKTSDAPVNTIEVSTIAYSLELNGRVFLDVDIGSDVGNHLGTIAKPVKTLTKALSICDSENISSIQLAGILVLDQDVSGKEFISWKNGKIDMNNQLAIATRFRELKVYGQQNSLSLFYNCRIGNLQGLLGVYDDCKFLVTDALELQAGQITLNNCITQILGDRFVTFDCKNNGVEFEVRNMSAGVQLINYKNNTNICDIGFNSGLIRIDQSCTDGTIYVGGSCRVDDQSTLDCVVDVVSLSNESIANAVAENEIITRIDKNVKTALVLSA
jgi:hypothetical protein